MALDAQVPVVASAAALTLPDSPLRRAGDQFLVFGVSGTANITSITAMRPGTCALLVFTGTAAAAGVVDGSNLKLTADFAYSPDDALMIVCDGTNWYELGRNAN